MAERVGIDLRTDIFEQRDFSRPGHAGCNMCGGIVYESMVQLLSTEGIRLPPEVVQREIDSYVLHMDLGSIRIETPMREKRIAAVHRGAGPRGTAERRWRSFDGFLLDLATAKGARVMRERVERLERSNGKPRIVTKGGVTGEYDLLVVASGVNCSIPKGMEKLVPGYRSPKTARTYICEFSLPRDSCRTYIGSSMHIFLLDIPRLEFAALIPKGDYVTVCLIGKGIDEALLDAFFRSPEVRRCFPPGWSAPRGNCCCSPLINVDGVKVSFADRVMLIGDSGVNRLYKDGIGGSYRTAKAAAKTAIFHGITADDFRRHYYPVCRAIAKDNRIGKVVFAITRLIQNLQFARRGLLRMTTREQKGRGVRRRMSGVLWDTFSGSASYRDVFSRSLHPVFLGRFAYETASGLLPIKCWKWGKEDKVALRGLGKVYKAGETIVRQGDVGDCMYVIQTGKVEVIKDQGGREIRLAELGEGDFFGEMALFEKDVRSATVLPLGDVRVLTVDRKIFLRKIHEDPSLVFMIIERMSRRLRALDEELIRLSSETAVSA
jgi:hypothetical protein